MSPNDDRSRESSPHEQVQHLLPWYVNHSLEAGERERVRTHLEHCPLCREEAAKLEAFAQLLARSPAPSLSPRASYGRLRDTLGHRGTGTRRPSWGERIRLAFGQKPAFVRLAFALALLLLALPLGLRQWKVLTEPRFYTLADPGPQAMPAEGDLRIVFDGTLGPERIEALLRGVNAIPLEGPDTAGVYTIRLAGSGHASDAIEAAITRLRGQKGILFVEPVRRP